jgi:hypothetical protein
LRFGGFAASFLTQSADYRRNPTRALTEWADFLRLTIPLSIDF